MGKCAVCGTADDLTRTCNYCGTEVCSSHTLPEKHNCASIRPTNNAGKHFESAVEATLGESNEPKDDSPEPIENPRTYGGSERDEEKAEFSSGPDVAIDGSISAEELDEIRESTTTDEGVTERLARKLELGWLRIKVATPRLRTVLIIVLLGVVTTGQLGIAPVPGLPVDPSPAESLLDDAEGAVTNATGTETRRSASGTTAASSDDGNSGLFGNELNRTRIEYLVHEEINERRQEQGLQPLDFDTELRTIARYHSRDMGEQRYFAHTAPDGESMEDRYEKYGYSCKVTVSGDRYATGAENIAYTYAFENVVRDNGEEVYYSNEKELAQGLVNQWMNSTGHRKNILRDYWQNEGIGVYVIDINGKTLVYATQNFC